jgi:ATP-binding cassette subfamily A (ABC1) protein 3
MDLSARRQMWDMLKEQKKGRIIVLTTHYMDEADILGDRIGIMSSGKVTALGSSIFLKTKFGVGYNLTLVKKNTNPNPEVIAYMEKHLGPNIIK